jgi:hypothetical protein
MDGQTLLPRSRGDLLHGGLRGGLVGGAAPVKGSDRLLVLGAHAQTLVLGGVDAGGEGAHALAPSGKLGVELGAGGAGAQQLAAVVAHVSDRPDRDDLAGDGGAAAADTADQAIAPGDLDQQRARGLGDVGVIGVAHDRGERAVDVEQHGGVGGVGAQWLQRLHKATGGGGHDP